MDVFTRVINTWPRNIINFPTPLVTKNVDECLRARMKACIAELQKLSPDNAICVKAVWFRNLINRWKQSTQHFVQHTMHLTGAAAGPALSSIFFTWLLINSNKSLTIQHIAKSKEPNAIEPKLYRIAHQSPVFKLNSPFESYVDVKYHLQTAVSKEY